MPHRPARAARHVSARLLVPIMTICVFVSSVIVDATVAATASESSDRAGTRRLTSAQEEADAAAARLAELHTAAAEAQSVINAGEVRIARLVRKRDELRVVLELEAVEVYKRGSPVSSLVLASSVEDLERRSRRHVYLEHVLGSDRAAIRRIEEVNASLAEERTSVGAARKVLDSARAAAARADVGLAEALRLVAAEKTEPDPDELDAATGRHVAIRAKHRATLPLPVAALNAARGAHDPACPVAGPVSYTDTFGSSRSGGRRHKGVDMLAEHGTPLAAITSGTITRTGSGGLGGISLYLQGDDGFLYFYAHNSQNVAEPGAHVEAGDVIGYVGDTGNASGTPHLHFEVDSGAVNPTPVVDGACADRLQAPHEDAQNR